MSDKSNKENSKQTLNQKQYSNLLTDLKNLIETKINQTNENAVSQLTLAYWQIGQIISLESITNKSGYLNSILKSLSGQLELERSILSRCFSFFKTYKKPPNNKILSWSHYRELMTIKDETLRSKLEQEASDQNWSRERLVSAIKSAKANPNSEPKLKRPTEATYLYEAKIIEVIDGDTLILNLDLGFLVNKEQRVRLAGINCPEMAMDEGQSAFHFLLNKAANIDTLMIQTKKIDFTAVT
jgi:hypothetical protein